MKVVPGPRGPRTLTQVPARQVRSAHGSAWRCHDERVPRQGAFVHTRTGERRRSPSTRSDQPAKWAPARVEMEPIRQMLASDALPSPLEPWTLRRPLPRQPPVVVEQVHFHAGDSTAQGSAACSRDIPECCPRPVTPISQTRLRQTDHHPELDARAEQQVTLEWCCVRILAGIRARHRQPTSRAHRGFDPTDENSETRGRVSFSPARQDDGPREVVELLHGY